MNNKKTKVEEKIKDLKIIVEIIEDFYDIDVQEKTRQNNIIIVKHHLRYLAMKYIKLTHQLIADNLNYKREILYNSKSRIEDLLSYDRKFQKDHKEICFIIEQNIIYNKRKYIDNYNRDEAISNINSFFIGEQNINLATIGSSLSDEKLRILNTLTKII
jgi:hypothetical protein